MVAEVGFAPLHRLKRPVCYYYTTSAI